MNDWHIVLLHTRRETLLKRAFERAFPSQVLSLHVPALGRAREEREKTCFKTDLLAYFKRYVYDPGIWKGRVLTVYGDGEYHHYTYALHRMALERRGLGRSTYFHFDNHRDDWGVRPADGSTDWLHCASFVDSLAHDHRAVPYFMGPEVYAKKDSRGYDIRGTNIPIYHNQFSQHRQASQRWTRNDELWGYTDARSLPARRDLAETPTASYLSFDLDLLAQSEIVTNFDQNELVKLRDLVRMVDRVREYKRVFSADILGFPDDCTHSLSALTMVILARRLMGLGIAKLLNYHTWLKQRQGGLQINLNQRERKSPLEEGEFLEVLDEYSR